jgi:hypothetical protein
VGKSGLEGGREIFEGDLSKGKSGQEWPGARVLGQESKAARQGRVGRNGLAGTCWPFKAGTCWPFKAGTFWPFKAGTCWPFLARSLTCWPPCGRSLPPRRCCHSSWTSGVVRSWYGQYGQQYGDAATAAGRAPPAAVRGQGAASGLTQGRLD